MTQVENMAPCTFGAFKNVRHPSPYNVSGAEEDAWIQIALNPTARPKGIDRIGHVYTPVEPDDICTALVYEREHGASVEGKVYYRDLRVQGRDDPLHIGQCK